MNQLLYLILVSLKRLGILEEVAVRMFYLKIKLDGLQKDPFMCHDLLLGVITEGSKVLFRKDILCNLDYVLAFLGGFLNLTS